ncbi:hypothetical protein BH10PSE7_BH10PSE7_23500 [soil metagenome]
MGLGTMGIILELPRARSGPARSAMGKSAEIVIFPGVQVERRDFTLADRIEPQRRRRQPAQSQAIDIEK